MYMCTRNDFKDLLPSAPRSTTTFFICCSSVVLVAFEKASFQPHVFLPLEFFLDIYQDDMLIKFRI